MRKVILILFVGFNLILDAQVPSFGSASELDAACWNIKWFGSNSNGPSDEILQFNNVLEVIRNTEIDVWGLSEISNVDTFNRLMDSLPNYAGLIAPINQSQKTAFVYNQSLFTLVHEKLVITDQSYDFASGRFPYEVAVLPKYGNKMDTLYFLILHLKANVGNAAAKQESWQRRKNASIHLKTYIDQNLAQKKVILMGDFNDDTDVSIYNNNQTPFANFLQDSNNFKFTTRNLTAANTSSTVSYNDMIDHQLMSNEWFSSYTLNSCKVIELQNYLINYGTTTSDHYPVFSSFAYQFSNLNSIPEEELKVYPNPLGLNEELKIENAEFIGVYDMSGKEVNDELLTHTYSSRQRGVYILHLRSKGEIIHKKLIID